MSLAKELTISYLRDKYEAGALSPQEVMATIVDRSIADADMNIWITPPTMDAIQPYLDRLASLSKADAPLWVFLLRSKTTLIWLVFQRQQVARNMRLHRMNMRVLSRD